MTTTTLSDIQFTSRVGGALSKSGSFNYEYIGAMTDYSGNKIPFRTVKFIFNISVDNYSYDKQTRAYINWTMYYNRQNENGKWSRREHYIRVDEKAVDMAIGVYDRIRLEKQLIDEYLTQLNQAVAAIQLSADIRKEKYFASVTDAHSNYPNN